MPRPNLFIGSIEIPLVSGFDLQQRYEPLASISNDRKADGTLHTDVAWTGKIRTRISGTGWCPPGLAALTLIDDYVIKCCAPDAVGSVSNVITIPAARRSDSGAVPFATAIVNGDEVNTTISLAGNVATLGVVSGASLYLCWYYPQFTGRIFEMPRDFNSGDATFPWSLVAEQV